MCHPFIAKQLHNNEWECLADPDKCNQRTRTVSIMMLHLWNVHPEKTKGMELLPSGYIKAAEV